MSISLDAPCSGTPMLRYNIYGIRHYTSTTACAVNSKHPTKAVKEMYTISRAGESHPEPHTCVHTHVTCDGRFLWTSVGWLAGKANANGDVHHSDNVWQAIWAT